MPQTLTTARVSAASRPRPRLLKRLRLPQVGLPCPVPAESNRQATTGGVDSLVPSPSLSSSSSTDSGAQADRVIRDTSNDGNPSPPTPHPPARAFPPRAPLPLVPGSHEGYHQPSRAPDHLATNLLESSSRRLQHRCEVLHFLSAGPRRARFPSVSPQYPRQDGGDLRFMPSGGAGRPPSRPHSRALRKAAVVAASKRPRHGRAPVSSPAAWRSRT